MNQQRAALKQARDGLKRIINENPSTVTVSNLPMISDGFGGMTPDIDGTPTTTSIKCRIAHERLMVPDMENTPAGISTNLSRFIITDYKNTITEYGTFSLIGRKWTIGPVDTIIKYGGTVGYQAPLREADGDG